MKYPKIIGHVPELRLRPRIGDSYFMPHYDTVASPIQYQLVLHWVWPSYLIPELKHRSGLLGPPCPHWQIRAVAVHLLSTLSLPSLRDLLSFQDFPPLWCPTRPCPVSQLSESCLGDAETGETCARMRTYGFILLVHSKSHQGTKARVPFGF